MNITKKKLKKSLLNMGFTVLGLLILLVIAIHSSFLQTQFINYFLRQQSKAIGISAQVHQVKVDWLSKNVRITGLSVYDHHKKLLIETESLRTVIRALSLSGIDLGATSVSGLKLQLRRYQEDSASNLKRILDFFVAPTSATSAFSFKCSNFHLNNGELSYVDEHLSRGDTSRFVDFNNVFLNQVEFSAKHIDVLNEQVLATIDNLSFKEKKGLEIAHFSSRLNLSEKNFIVRNAHIRTISSDLNLNLRFKTNHWRDYQNFISNVYVFADFERSKLDMHDLVLFAPSLEGMNNRLSFSGNAWGFVNHFQTQKLDLSYGKNTNFNGDVLISGLPDINASFFKVFLNEFRTTSKDIRSFLLPASVQIPVPKELDSFGIVHVLGELSGNLKEVSAMLDITSDRGQIETNVHLVHDPPSGLFDFSGNINQSTLSFGKIIGQERFGNLSAHGSFDGSYSSKNGIKLSADLTCRDLEIGNHFINTIVVRGDWSGATISTEVSLIDELGTANLSGDFSIDTEHPNLKANGHLEGIDLQRLKILNDTNRPLLSTDFSAEITQWNLDSLIGNLHLSNTQIQVSDTIYRMRHFSFSQDLVQEGFSANVRCDFFNADISGNYKISKMHEMLENIQNRYASVIAPTKQTSDSSHHFFRSKIHIIQTNELFSYFLSDLKLPFGADLDVTYDYLTQPEISVKMHAKNILVDRFSFQDFELEGHPSTDRIFSLRAEIKNLLVNDTSYFKDIAIGSEWENNLGFWTLKWKGNPGIKTVLDGNFGGRIDLLDKNKIALSLQNSKLVFMQQTWLFDSDNRITMSPQSILFNNIRFSNQDQPKEFLTLNGELSKDPDSELEFVFNQYRSDAWMSLINHIGMSFSGLISGNVRLKDVYKDLRVLSDIRIEDFCINSHNYGTMHLKTITPENSHNSFIMLDVQDSSSQKPYLSAKGNFSPRIDSENFDLAVSVSELDLSLLKNYVQSFSSAIGGKIEGDLTLKGSLKDPRLYGVLRTDQAVLKVDYLNTVYALSCDSISFGLDSIVISEAKIEDTLYHTSGILSGRLDHKRFDQMKFDIQVDMQNLFVLNTSQWMNEDYFGKAFGSGKARISGTPENLLIDVNGKTERGTDIWLNYASQVNVSQGNTFVHFVSKNDLNNLQTVSDPASEQTSNLAVRLNMEVTPEASFSFDMNVPPTVGTINATGSGLLRLDIDATGKFTMFGDYVLQDGYYDFSFEEKSLGRLITRRFNIERDGVLQWTGDPSNMLMNISAVYSTRASLYPVLASSYDQNTTENANENMMHKVNVQSVISLEGRMQQPSIKFDFRLPNVDEETRTEFFSLLNREDESEMSKQTVFLLFLGSFTTPGNNSNVLSGNAGTDVSTVSLMSEILNNQLNSVFQNFSNTVNFGVNWTPEDANHTQQTQFSFSTQFLDNRLLLDGHLSQGGLSKNLSSETQDFMGEFNVEYRITNRMSIRAFNRPSERDLFTRNQSGYLQGVGISLKRDFGSLREVFVRKKKRSLVLVE